SSCGHARRLVCPCNAASSPLSSGPNAKTRKAQGLAGFGPGGFIPLTFLLCHSEKNKSRTFFKKSEKLSPRTVYRSKIL
ncbi:hypothetical protein, partial [Thalassospira sp.]|uniref:hypothetical protein n=1 Tax=Thalassospira sp. TaxID=1912094 RepID=UPI0027371412